MIHKGPSEGLIKGMAPYVYEKGCAILQYAVDTLFLLEDGEISARNLKVVLRQLFGLEINFHKSEVFWFGHSIQKQHVYEDIFTCCVVQLPIKYLGIPVSNVRLLNIDWIPAENSMEKELGCSQGKLLSIGGRLALLIPSLSNRPLYVLSIYGVPKEWLIGSTTI